MKWFKHYSDMHKGRSINELLDRLGHTGLCFFLLQEMCAEKMGKSSESLEGCAESLEERSTTFHFHHRVVRQNLRVSGANLLRLLGVCAEVGLLTFKFSEKTVEIKMPILLNLLDRDSKKARITRAFSAQKTILDKDKDEDKDEDKYKDKDGNKELLPKHKNKIEKTNIELNRKIWESYSDAYFLRYKVLPVRNQQVNGKISQIGKRLGDEAIQVIKFFVLHNDGYYLKNLHAIGLCLKDAESLRTQMVRGKSITSNDVRNFEKTQNAVSVLKAIENGENF